MAPKKKATPAKAAAPLTVAVLAGRFSVSQKALAAELEAAGLTVARKPSDPNVSHVVCNDPSAAAAVEAASLGLPVLTEADLRVELAKLAAAAAPQPAPAKRAGRATAQPPVQVPAAQPAPAPAAAQVKRGRAAAPAAAPAAVSVPAAAAKRGRKTAAAAVAAATAPAVSADMIDPMANVTGPAVALASKNGVTLDYMLSFKDATSDKYYIGQVIDLGGGVWISFTHWGRTGTKGQCQSEKCTSLALAAAAFCTKFREKSGVDWSAVEAGSYAPVAGKYAMLGTPTHAAMAKSRASGVIWRYYVDDFVNGKSVGWYDYDLDASEVVENLYQAWLLNPGQQVSLANRLVTSESSGFNYAVDLDKMEQTNSTTGKIRKITRHVPGAVPSAKIPSKAKAMASAKASASAVVATLPTSRVKAQPVAAKPTKRKAPAKAPVAKKAPPAAATSATPVRTVDSEVARTAPFVVHGDYDCMLNQTDISHNNNKFYRIQLLVDGGNYSVFTRWGRVGDTGQHSLQPFYGNEDGAVKAFKKKFQEKTRNSWDNRDNFQKVDGQYDQVEMDLTGRGAAAAAAASADAADDADDVETLPCTLDDTTRDLVDMLFSKDMFKSAMSHLQVDVEKLPLGALSETQVKRGLEVLEEIDTELQGARRQSELSKLSSRFYTVIPHAFSRSQVPTVINTPDLLKQKFDLVNTLSDIEKAQTMDSERLRKARVATVVEHPADLKFDELQIDLQLVDPKSTEYALLHEYVANTGSPAMAAKLRAVWALSRHGESDRFEAYDSITNRRLLWHGTNVAVVAAICRCGLRIMPHSGGRVGRGIYLASQHNKSSAYVTPTRHGRGHVGVMFLVEAALGNEYHIKMDSPMIVAPPKGYDSVVALGLYEPDPSADAAIQIDGRVVTVPRGQPIKMPRGQGSNFDKSEYLLYEEARHRIRYLFTFDF